jgi:hypothetical protein
VDHVGADAVGPVHVAPYGGVGVVLEKHVVVAFPEDGAVRVIHPVGDGKQVKLRAERIRSESRAEFGSGLRVASEVVSVDWTGYGSSAGSKQKVAARRLNRKSHSSTSTLEMRNGELP